MVISLTGCKETFEEKYEIDQCIRKEIFMTCLDKLPSPPPNAIPSDWDEVVNECADLATRAAYRLRETVPAGCA
jgi:hypothetical protein